MEQPIWLLAGTGALIVLAAALFFKKPSRPASGWPQRPEQAELEKTMQRFVRQIQQENERVAAGSRRKVEELSAEIGRLQHRLAQAEQMMKDLRGQLDELKAGLNSRPENLRENEDALLLKERYKRVFELQGEGMQADEIAKRLGAGRGEIELILSLAAPQHKRSAQ